MGKRVLACYPYQQSTTEAVQEKPHQLLEMLFETQTSVFNLNGFKSVS